MLKQTVTRIKSLLPTQQLNSKVSRQVKLNNLTYLSERKIYHLEQCIKQVERKNVQGCFIEAGIALGGSAIIMSTLMSKNRVFHGYDVFEMIPSPSSMKDDEKSKARYEVIKSGQSEGINGDTYYGYESNLYDKVVENFNKFDLQVDGKTIFLHKGLFEDTLSFDSNAKIALAHIDCDWYEPVYLCLERIYRNLSNNGYIILDDYYDYGGCKKATDEFLSSHNDVQIVARDSNLVLTRKM